MPFPSTRVLIFLAASVTAISMIPVATALAASLTFSTTTIALTSPAVNFTIASGSIADALTVNATSVLVSLSASGGNSFTLTSPQSDIQVSASAGGGTDPLTCLGQPGLSGATAEVVLTQQSGSATYTIVPGGSYCVSINTSGGGGIRIYPIAIHAPAHASTTVGNTVVIPVTATDPNAGQTATITATLPLGASFSKTADGYALMWTPFSAGTATATFVASDQITSITATISLETFAPAAGGSGAGSSSLASASSSLPASVSSSTSTAASSSPSLPDLTSRIAQLTALLQTLIAQAQSRGMPVLSSLLPASSSSPASSGRHVFTVNLRLWDANSEVRALQDFLIRQNVGPAAQKLSIHGATTIFGRLTFDALIEYQKYAGLPPTGYFGPLTRARVNGQ